MVSIKTFDTIFPELTQYYGKSEAFAGNNLAQAAWVEALKQLTDQEFAIAAKRCIQKYRTPFMPSPEEFVELVTGNSELFAIQEWQKILDWNHNYFAKRGITKDIPPLLLSGHGERSLRKIGGLKAINNLQESENTSVDEKLRFLEKDFIKYWIEYKRAIGIGQIEPPPPILDQSHQKEVKIHSTSEPIDFDAFKKMREQLKQSVPAFGERIEKAAPPREKERALSPVELQEQREEKQAHFAESTEKFKAIANKF